MNDTTTRRRSLDPFHGWNRRDRASAWMAVGMAAVAVTFGVLSGGYDAEASAPTTDTPAVTVAYCSQYAHGEPDSDTIPGVCYLPTTDARGYHTLDTAEWGTDIPRCASDDWNETHLPRCYTEAPGEVIVVDQDDTTLATITG